MQRVIKPDPTSDLAARLQNFTKRDSAGCTMYTDYRKMIDEAHLDAVIVTAPDHHHVQAAILACQAGLDVYCEKPLTLTIGEGKKLVEAVRYHGRVLQVGSQQRSMEMDRFAMPVRPRRRHRKSDRSVEVKNLARSAALRTSAGRAGPGRDALGAVLRSPPASTVSLATLAEGRTRLAGQHLARLGHVA